MTGSWPPERDGVTGSGGATSPTLKWRRVAIGALITTSAFAGVYLLLSKLVGFGPTWSELRHADPGWLALAAVLEVLSLAGYAALFATVIARGVTRIGWRGSVQIPLAGIAALRVLATGGAGGFALTAWALSRAGMSRSMIASRMVANVILQYTVYLAALVVCGIGLWTGLLPGGGSFAITIVPALLALALMVSIGVVALLPGAEPSLAPLPGGVRWRQRALRWLLVGYSTVRAGTRAALALLARPRLGLLGVLAYWAFDVSVLWCAFRAFGQPPPVPVVVMAYFVGTLGDLLPLPGGIGGVDGGMVAVLLAFGVPSGRAVVAVLVYRAFSFWLPTLPGIASYIKLRATIRGWQHTPQTPDSPTASENMPGLRRGAPSPRWP